MSARFFTNEGENTLLKKSAGVFAANPDIVRFDALVGYLRSSDYFSIRPHLEKVHKIRILVGINVDEIVETYHSRGHLILVDAGIRQFVEDVVGGRLEIKAHPTRNLPTKIYLFIPEGFREHKTGSVITGSSNLTDSDPGSKDHASNYEFNVLLHDFSNMQYASAGRGLPGTGNLGPRTH